MASVTLVKKSVSVLLLVSTLFVSSATFFPKSVAAQLAAAEGQADGGFNIQGLGAVAANCVDLTGLIQRGVRAVGNAFGFSTSSPETAAIDAMAVPTKDMNTRENTVATKDQVKSNNLKEQCFDAIARYAVLKVIDKITLMTVEWINHGFQGNPFYPENRPNFFEEIAQEEVLGFTRWFSANPEDYPFGEIISETLLLTVQNRLEDNLRFSLNQVLQHNNQYAGYDSFTAKFSVGGWAGYTAFGQTNNNVFGNYLLANDHLGKQVAGTNYTISKNFEKELFDASGFLNQRECVQTADSSGDPYIDPENELHLGGRQLIPNGGTMTQSIYESLPPAVQAELDSLNGTDQQAEYYNYFIRRSTCVKWRTVTPGRLLADSTSQVLGSPLRNLELGDEFNENLGLIFDALSVQLFKKVQGGIRSLYNSNNDYSSDPNDPNYNPLWAQVNNSNFGNSTQQVPVGTAINGDGVDPGLIEIQQNFITQAAINIESLTTLIRDIRTLDYTIPGPNPNWYDEAAANMQNLINSVPPSTSFDFEVNHNYYVGAVNSITGINLFSLPDLYLTTHQGFIDFCNFIFAKYRDAMLATYSLNNPPPAVRVMGSSLFDQIPTYEAQIQALQTDVNNLVSVMPQLINIQTQLVGLGPNPDPDSPEMQLITSMLSQISSQGVLINQAQYDQVVSDNLVYQSQITMVNNLIQQGIAEITGSYSAGNERVNYPFPSITENEWFNLIPGTVPLFLNNQSFNDNGNGPLDISDYPDFNVNITATSTETLADNLQSIY